MFTLLLIKYTYIHCSKLYWEVNLLVIDKYFKPSVLQMLLYNWCAILDRAISMAYTSVMQDLLFLL